MASEQLTSIQDSNLITSGFFEDIENLSYRLEHATEKGISYLIYKNDLIDVRDIPNFYTMKNNIEVFTVNGHTFDLSVKWQKARFEKGFWLELAVQVALCKAKIDFKGNPLNFHYPHSTSIIVDIETENMLIECTNIKESLNFEGWQEKINYFHRKDPKHLKKWVLITTFKKAIPKLIRQQIANYDITVLLINETVNSKNHNQIAELLVNYLIDLNEQALNNSLNTNYININKTRYQNHSNNSLVPNSHLCGLSDNKNESGLNG